MLRVMFIDCIEYLDKERQPLVTFLNALQEWWRLPIIDYAVAMAIPELIHEVLIA